MRKAVLLAAIPLFLVPAIAQSQAEAALNATRVKSSLLLSPNKTSVDFGVDGEKLPEEMQTLKPSSVFSVKTSRGLNVMLAFQNPLKMTWGISTKDGPDALVASIESFLTSAAAFTTGVVAPPSAATPSSTTPQATDPLPFRATTGMSAVKEARSVVDPALLTAEHLFKDAALRACRDKSASVRTSAAAHAGELDKLVYSDQRTREKEGDAVGTAADFRLVVTSALGEMLGASSMAALNTAASNMARALVALEESNKAARSLVILVGHDRKLIADLAEAERLRSTTAGKSTAARTDAPVSTIPVLFPATNGTEGPTDPDVAAAQCQAALEYSDHALTSFVVRSKPMIDAREALVVELKNLSTDVKNASESSRASEHFKIGRVDVTSGRRASVVVTFRERNVGIRGDQVVVENGKSQTVTFEVMEHQSVVPEFVPGLAYSQVSFRRFKTNDSAGVHVVADGGDYQPHTIPMGMLNLMPNTGWSGFTRLVGQVGVGVTKESVVVLTGGGIRFSQPVRFVLSVGALFPFEQELTDLKLGSVVAGEAALQKDLQRTIGKPSLYIAIQK